MTERENALHVINRTGKAQWVPIACRCFKLMIPSVVMERPKVPEGDDWFGFHWKYDVPSKGYAPVHGEKPMLENVCDWEKVVKFPDPDNIDWEGAAKKDLEGFDREQQLLQMFWESGPFERSHHLMGFEGAFFAMYDEPEAYKAFLNAITDFRIKAMGYAIDAYKPDLVFTHDDIGGATAPLMSLENYREFLKPCHMRLEQFIRSKGVIVEQHSCGKVEPFIGDMIECGAQIINCLQGKVNNQEAVQAKYGKKVVFDGGLSPINHSGFATEEELRADVRRAIDLFREEGNLIINTGSCYARNHEILTDEAEKYGRLQ